MTPARYHIMLTKPPRRAWQAYALHKEDPIDLLAGMRIRSRSRAYTVLRETFPHVPITISEEGLRMMRLRFLEGRV
jgi:hypothetical protein